MSFKWPLLAGVALSFLAPGAAARADTTWSCSASCLFRAYADGSVSRISDPVAADGPTAGQAFAKLTDLCKQQDDAPGLHTDYYAALVQSDGTQTYPATLQNSCLH